MNAAKPASTRPTSTSIRITPALMALPIGVSFWPKHAGQAKAARGAARSSSVMSSVRISAGSLHPPRLALERRPVDGEPGPGGERHRAGDRVAGLVIEPILAGGPGREEGSQHDRQRD